MDGLLLFCLCISIKSQLAPIVASATMWYFHSSTWPSFCLQPQGTHVFISSMLSHFPFLSSPSFLYSFLLFLFLLPDLFFLLLSPKHYFPSAYYEPKNMPTVSQKHSGCTSLLFRKLTILMYFLCLFYSFLCHSIKHRDWYLLDI